MARQGRTYVVQLLPDEEEYSVLVDALRKYVQDATTSAKDCDMAWGILAEMHRNKH